MSLKVVVVVLVVVVVVVVESIIEPIMPINIFVCSFSYLSKTPSYFTSNLANRQIRWILGPKVPVTPAPWLERKPGQ